jgi:hypothetical protein
MASKTPAPADPLSEMAKAMNDNFSDESMYGTASVPQSPVREISPQALAGIVETTPLTQTSTGKGIPSGKLVKHHDPARWEAMQKALETKEKDITTPSHYAHEGYEVRMPGAVREKPNALYFKIDGVGRMFAIRDKADAIQAVLFDDENERVHELCRRSGFGLKPLVFISEQLHHHLDNDILHDFKAYGAAHNDPGFSADMDEESGSPFIQALYLIFEIKTVKDICRAARYQNVSVLTIMRCILSDICKDRGVSENFGKPVEVTK